MELKLVILLQNTGFDTKYYGTTLLRYQQKLMILTLFRPFYQPWTKYVEQWETAFSCNFYQNLQFRLFIFPEYIYLILV